MAKTWVLDTETKGTGAHMVPLEKVLRGRDREPELSLVKLGGSVPPRPAAEPDPPKPRIFKVLDLMSRETLAEGLDLRATLELLGDVRSVVDVQVYVWDADHGRWRMLRLDERRALWEARPQGRIEPHAARPRIEPRAARPRIEPRAAQRDARPARGRGRGDLGRLRRADRADAGDPDRPSRVRRGLAAGAQVRR